MWSQLFEHPEHITYPELIFEFCQYIIDDFIL